MKKKFNLKHRNLLMLFLSLFLGWSCTNNDTDPNAGKLSISANSTFTNLTTKTSGNRVAANNIVIEDFKLNISKFELEVDSEDDNYHEDENEHWDDDGFYDYDDEIELMGPYELDLMSGQISFLNVDVPNGMYDELEFKFDVSTDPLSDLFGKSVLIKGTIDDIPFVFWHDFDDEVEVDFEDPQFDISISQVAQEIVITFDLGQILNSVNGVDLSLAKDGNQDGTIEISPEDPDGNNQLAESIRHYIKEYINLLED